MELFTLRWGRRSTGGVVRRGHGGWTLAVGFPPALSYTNPDTGDGATVVGWRLLRARRSILATATGQVLHRLVAESNRVMAVADDVPRAIFTSFGESVLGVSRGADESADDYLERLAKRLEAERRMA